jgi:hypothetical protein
MCASWLSVKGIEMNMRVQQQSGVSNVGQADKMEPDGEDKEARIIKLLEELLRMLAQDSRKSGDDAGGDSSSGHKGNGGCKSVGPKGKTDSTPPSPPAGNAQSNDTQNDAAKGDSASQQTVGSQSTPNGLPNDKKETVNRAEQDFDAKYGSFMQPGEKDKAQFDISDPGSGNAGVTQLAHGGEADQIKLSPDMKGSTLYHVAGHEKAHASMSEEYQSAFGTGPGSQSAIEGGAEMLANSATPDKGFSNAYYDQGYVGNAEKVRDTVGEETFSKAFFGGDAAAIKQVKQTFDSMGAT